MLVKKADRVERQPVTMEGVTRTEIQWLLSREDGVPTVALRRFTMRPGGTIPLHGHAWEHEIYVVAGRGRAFTEERSMPIEVGDTLYIPADEPHGYENDGDGDFVFLCVVPLSAT